MSYLSAVSASGLDAIAAMAVDPAGTAVPRKAMDASASASRQLLGALPSIEPGRGTTFDYRA